MISKENPKVGEMSKKEKKEKQTQVPYVLCTKIKELEEAAAA